LAVLGPRRCGRRHSCLGNYWRISGVQESGNLPPLRYLIFNLDGSAGEATRFIRERGDTISDTGGTDREDVRCSLDRNQTKEAYVINVEFFCFEFYLQSA